MKEFHTLLSSLILSTTIIAKPTPTAAYDLPLTGGTTSNDGWDQSSWYVGVDGVMGGKSRGYVSYSDDPNGTMTFYGTINTDGGGFANVGRYFRPSLDLTPYAGIVVEMEAERWTGGDGSSAGGEGEKPFGFHLQMGDAGSGYYGFSSAFAVPLAEEDGVGTAVYLPLDGFDRGSTMGYICSNCGLDTTKINEMQIYALFQEGSFRIDAKSITAVADPQSFLSPSIIFTSEDDVEALIEATIASGSKVYDYGYREICIAIYWSTLNTILEATGISDALKGVACSGVKMVDPYGDKAENAWNLRYTLDALLADIRGVERSWNSPAWLKAGEDVMVLREGCIGYTSVPSSHVGTGSFDTVINETPNDTSMEDTPSNKTPDETSTEDTPNNAETGSFDTITNETSDKKSVDDIANAALGLQYLYGNNLVLYIFFGIVYVLW